MIDKDLNGIVFSQSPGLSKYSSVSITKGLKLSKKISSQKKIFTPKIESRNCQHKQVEDRYIWKCIDTIYHYSSATIQHVSVSCNGDMFAVSFNYDKDVDIWSLEKRKVIKTIECLSVSAFEFSQDSSKIIICEDPSLYTNLYVKSIESGGVEHQVELRFDDLIKLKLDELIVKLDNSNRSEFVNPLSLSLRLDDITAVVISRGLNLVAIHYENQIYIWDITTGFLLHKINSQKEVFDRNLSIAHESPILIVQDNCPLSKAEIWNPITGKFICYFDSDFHFEPNLGTALTYDGSILFNSNEFIEIGSGCSINNLNDDDFGFACLEDDDKFYFSSASSFSQDGKTLVIGGHGGAIKILKKFSLDELLALESKEPGIKGQLLDKFIQLANKHCKFGDFVDAIDSYTTAIKIDPNNFQAYNGRSTARSALGDYRGAMEDLQKARQMN